MIFWYISFWLTWLHFSSVLGITRKYQKIYSVKMVTLRGIEVHSFVSDIKEYAIVFTEINAFNCYIILR